MKLDVVLIACIYLVPEALSLSEPCDEGLIYCGSTLETYHGMFN
jgi:hypothetical protein